MTKLYAYKCRIALFDFHKLSGYCVFYQKRRTPTFLCLVFDHHRQLRICHNHLISTSAEVPVIVYQRVKDATIIHLFKRKGNPQVCDNHRGISLLTVAGKILARSY